MIGIDTNVLVRYFVKDDLKQASCAKDFLLSLSPSNQGFISSIVLVEMVWTLQKAYRIEKTILYTVLEELILAPEIVLENNAEVQQAYVLCKNEGFDFSDALLGLIHAKSGCESTVTFDKRASKLPTFEAL